MTTEVIAYKWICDGLKPYNFKNINVKLTGLTEAGDGYVGDIAFAKVNAIKANATNEELDVVVKYSKSDLSQRAKFPVSALFQSEIFAYSTLVPVFKTLEEKAKLNVLNSFIPKCYNTLQYENQEVLVLENLQIGYELHDRTKPMDFDHHKLTFRNYGVWHAFGLAYREKYPTQFESARRELKSHIRALETLLGQLFRCSEENINAILEKAGETEILNRLTEQKIGFTDKYLEYLNTDEDNSVIVHGDGWNNNFMFKYKGRDQVKPEAVKLIDFQLIHVAPPVFDLAYHIYATGSESGFNEFPALIRIYYDSLSSCLSELGFDPEKVFPFSELERQWKTYSIQGLIWGSMAIPFCICEKEDIVDMAAQDEALFRQMFEKVRIKNFDAIKSRTVPALRHYFNYCNGFNM